MNYDLLFRKFLQIAIERDCINDYLVGRLAFRVKEDPNSEHTHHAFDYGILVYNNVNKEQPELNLPVKYVEALEKELSNENIRDIKININEKKDEKSNDKLKEFSPVFSKIILSKSISLKNFSITSTIGRGSCC